MGTVPRNGGEIRELPWLVNQPPLTYPPPRNSRPYDQGLLTIGFP